MEEEGCSDRSSIYPVAMILSCVGLVVCILFTFGQIVSLITIHILLIIDEIRSICLCNVNSFYIFMLSSEDI